MDQDEADILGALIWEYETHRTINGESIPRARDMEIDEWYSAVGRQMLAAIDKRLH